MMEWISVKDQFPPIIPDCETSEVVLAFTDYGVLPAKCFYYPAKGFRKTDEYVWSEQSTGCGCCSADIVVSHWMPLPEPPKE